VELSQGYQGFWGVIGIKFISTMDRLCIGATPPTLVYFHPNYNLDVVQASK
jgi:hypothetical protein